MRPYVERGTVKELWPVGCGSARQNFSVCRGCIIEKRINENGRQAGYRSVGQVEVSPNSVQGYDYEADGNGIVLLPERVIFNKERYRQKYDF